MATDISKLAVILTASTAGFSSGLKGGESALTSLGGTAERVKGILSGWTGLLGSIGLGFSLWSGVEKAVAAEEAVAKLDSVLRSTGGAAGFTTGELEKVAVELAQVTKFGKAATISAAAVLGTFTNIRGDQFRDALVAAQNLSTVLGTDLQASVVQLGKALNDPSHGYTALKRAGVSFSQSQIEQIKTLQDSGDVMAAQKIILGELAVEFGGAAEAVGGGFGAQIERAKAAVGSIATAIMNEALPAFSKFAGIAKDAALWVKAHKDAMALFARVLVGTAAAVTTYKVALFAVTVAQRAVAAGAAILQALEGPTGWLKLAGATAALTAGLYAVDYAFGNVEKSTQAAAAPIAALRAQMDGAAAEGEMAEDAIDGIGNALDQLPTKAKKAGDALASVSADIHKQFLSLEQQVAHPDLKPSEVKTNTEIEDRMKAIEARRAQLQKVIENQQELGVQREVDAHTRKFAHLFEPQDMAADFKAMQAAGRAANDQFEKIQKAKEELRKIDLSAEELKRSKEMLTQADAIKAQVKETDDLGKALQRITDQTETAEEKFEGELSVIDNALQAGMIGLNEAAELQDRLADQLAKDQDRGQKKYKPPEFKNFAGDKVAALERRFTAGFSGDVQNPMAKIEKNTAASAKHGERTARATEEVARNTAKPPEDVDF